MLLDKFFPKRNFSAYVEIKDPQKIKGEIVTRQLRSVDYMARYVEKIESCDLLTWIEVVELKSVCDPFGGFEKEHI